MAELIPWGKTRLLLVEGQDDEVFFKDFVDNLAASWDARLPVSQLAIIQYGGRTRLTQLLRELKKTDNFEVVTHIGIVRDSDFNTDAFRSVQDRIKTVNSEGPPQINVPFQPLEPTESVPQVSVLIVPAANREGMLDDLVMDALQVDPNCSVRKWLLRLSSGATRGNCSGKEIQVANPGFSHRQECGIRH